LNNQNWRYAIKKFDAAKKISASDLDLLKKASSLELPLMGYSFIK
jgi:hypothetical protein